MTSNVFGETNLAQSFNQLKMGPAEFEAMKKVKWKRSITNASFFSLPALCSGTVERSGGSCTQPCPWDNRLVRLDYGCSLLLFFSRPMLF